MPKLSYAQLAALVKRIQKGDTEAFATLYAATVEGQLYFATAFLKDSALAEDAVQEVYLSLYRNIHKLEKPKLFVAYLNRICYNTCVNYKRKLAKIHSELNDDYMVERPDTDLHNIPDERYDRLEASNELHQVLAQLPDHLRAVFLYRFYYELKIAEIAAIMGCSESTVKRQIKSATAQLKLLLLARQSGQGEKGSNYAL